jgi:L-aspartate oxidase
VALGVRFDREEGSLALGREAAHSRRRIIHAGGDTTGAEIQRGLHQALRDASVDAREGHNVLRLIVEDGACVGLLAERGGEIIEYRARALVLASGGAGRLYSHTTNPPTANGDGAALAYEAGAELMDMEFFQFHPTALAKEGAPSFLISEAVRGEGAVLRNQAGERFMVGRHPQAELAPRDVVAREIWREMAEGHSPCAYLDLREVDADRVRGRFPQIYATCLLHGIDITQDLIPVAPAAHYMIGGVRTDLDGATTLPGLFGCGEVANAGVHGANRLASNSLLESVVFSRRAARAAAEFVSARVSGRGAIALGERGGTRRRSRRLLALPSPQGPAQEIVDAPALPELMWQGVGLVRDGGGLAGTLGELGDGGSSRQHRTAWAICASALLREESRGCHFRADYAQTDASWLGHVVLQVDEGPQFEARAG